METYADREIRKYGIAVLSCENYDHPSQSMVSSFEKLERLHAAAAEQLEPYAELRADGTVVPTVGAPGTWSPLTDQHACTVIRATTHTVWVQDDKFVLVAGSTEDGSAQYRYERDPKGAVRRFTRRHNGTWRGTAGWLVLGWRREYRDPSF